MVEAVVDGRLETFLEFGMLAIFSSGRWRWEAAAFNNGMII